jgi:hypothetical protein
VPYCDRHIGKGGPYARSCDPANGECVYEFTDTPCSKCEACMESATGVADGTCAPVLPGLDPRDQCEGALACAGDRQCYAKALGEACSDGPSQCTSGYCAPEGICCESACNGICEQCSALGSCVPIPDGHDPDNECADDQGYGCNGERACHSGAVDGVACGDGSQCASNHCVDNFCCNLTCDGTCVACSAAKSGGENGVCTPVPELQDPDKECASFGCNGAAACNPPKSWRTPVPLERNSGANPQIAMDRSGHAIAVWTQSDGTRGNIWARSYTSGSGWDAAARSS